MTEDPLKGIKDMRKELEGIKAEAAFVRPVFEKIDLPKLPESVTNPAGWVRKRLMEYIKDFEEDLDEEHEIGARLVSFGQTLTFHILNVGYYGPDIINFDGVSDSGEKVQLIQHISQLSVLLIALRKLGEKARRIGFNRGNEDQQDERET